MFLIIMLATGIDEAAVERGALGCTSNVFFHCIQFLALSKRNAPGITKLAHQQEMMHFQTKYQCHQETLSHPDLIWSLLWMLGALAGK